MRKEKKYYNTPWAEIDAFEDSDVIRTSGSQDDYDEEDENPWGNGGNGNNAAPNQDMTF